MDAFNKAARELGFNLQKIDAKNPLDDCYLNLNPKKTVFYTDSQKILKDVIMNKTYDNIRFVDEVKWAGINMGISFFPVQGYYLDKKPQLSEYRVTLKQFEDMKKDFDDWFNTQTDYRKKDLNAIDKGWRNLN